MGDGHRVAQDMGCTEAAPSGDAANGLRRLLCLPCPRTAGLVASQSHSHPNLGGARRDLPIRGALRVFFLSRGHLEISRRLRLGLSPFSSPRPSGPFLHDFPGSSPLCTLPGAPEVGGQLPWRSLGYSLSVHYPSLCLVFTCWLGGVLALLPSPFTCPLSP